jgi:hypothetical protein
LDDARADRANHPPRSPRLTNRFPIDRAIIGFLALTVSTPDRYRNKIMQGEIRSIIGAVLVCVFSAAVAEAQQNVVADGDFETPVLTDGSFQFFFAPTTLGPWNVTAGIADLITDGYAANAAHPGYLTPDGNQWVLMGDSGPVCTLTQDLSTQLLAGTNYFLSFLQTPLFADARTSTMKFELIPTGGGAAVYSHDFVVPPGGNAFAQQSDNLTVPSTGFYTLTITTPGNTPGQIDAVSLVPEPASTLLLLAAPLLASRRRSR